MDVAIPRQRLTGMLALAVAAAGLPRCDPSQARLDAVVEQIEGADCEFEAAYVLVGGDSPADLSLRHQFPLVARHRCEPRSWSLLEFGDPSFEARCQIDAARCAASLRDRRVVPALIHGLSNEVDEHDTGDGKLQVRAHFAEALGVLGDDRAVEPLVEAFASSKPVAQASIGRALAAFGRKARAAGPALERALRRANTEDDMSVERLHSAAASTLAVVDPGRAARAFAEILRHPYANPHLTELVMDAVASSDPPMPIEDSIDDLAEELSKKQRWLELLARRGESHWLYYRLCQCTAAELERRGEARISSATDLRGRCGPPPSDP